MEKLDIRQELSGNRYPGRGILIGQTPDATHAVVAYFIMGRSENSRNRIFEETADGIRTQAFDPAKLEDPSLIIYAPVRTLGNRMIVTNGDQTDTIYETIQAGGSFIDALRTRTFEPDAPNFTPRISGLLEFAEEADTFTYALSILKSTDGDPAAAQRFFFEYQPTPGLAHFIHTYRCDGNPRIPSFEGDPKAIALGNESVDALADRLWSSLDDENKVSLFVRYVDLKSGESETCIVNKNQ